MPYIPHTESDIEQMLTSIGVDDIETLFDEVPQALRCDSLHEIAEGMTEMEAGRFFKECAAMDIVKQCFIGAGAYEHHIPAAVWEVATRGEFMTAYTPYQAEASQGTLQLLYEFQTMMANLTGMECSNASLYDGASATAEAILMAVRANRKAKSKRILIPRTLHPHYRKVIAALVGNQGIELVEVDYDRQAGCIDVDGLEKYAGKDIAAVVIPQPNFFGMYEDVHTITNWAHEKSALVIAVVNPISLAVLEAPGNWGETGADIVVGEGQPLGIPLASGGPYFGFMCCKKDYVRQMPGRIIGRTEDLNGKPGFVLTLQAREQHIRRSKATSNICTNQGLAVTAATIYMSLLGAEGLRRVALASCQNTEKLVKLLANVNGISKTFATPHFHEVVLTLDKPAKNVLAELAEQGIQAGYDLSKEYPELGNALLVCVTETKIEADLKQYCKLLANSLSNTVSKVA